LTSALRASVRRDFYRFTKRFEGEISFFYLDVRYLVTICIGNLCDPVERALSLPMVRKDGTPATRAEIAADWQKVKSDRSLAKRGWTAARDVAELRLPATAFEPLVTSRLNANAADLALQLPDFALWPAPAQLAICSWAWAVGSRKEFPKMFAALGARDFAGAAAECRIDETDNAGVIGRNVSNKALLLMAAEVGDDGDPDALVMPWEMSAPHPGLTDGERAVALAILAASMSQSLNDRLEIDRGERDRERDTVPD
jgi:GH24 family phage-related lysozyme (muramidase)